MMDVFMIKVLLFIDMIINQVHNILNEINCISRINHQW